MRRYVTIAVLLVVSLGLAFCADRRGQQIRELEDAAATQDRNHALDLSALRAQAGQDATRLAARAGACRADSSQAYDLGFALGSARCGLEP